MKPQQEATQAVDFKHLVVTSDVFEDGASIPERFTCDGKNINPPLDIEHIPQNALTLAVVMEDPDVPLGNWVHWVAWNIPVTHHIKENCAAGVAGTNSYVKTGYFGPCPPYGTHHYTFKVYALNNVLHLPAGSNKIHLEKEMGAYIAGYGEITGVYKSKIPHS